MRKKDFRTHLKRAGADNRLWGKLKTEIGGGLKTDLRGYRRKTRSRCGTVNLDE